MALMLKFWDKPAMEETVTSLETRTNATLFPLLLNFHGKRLLLVSLIHLPVKAALKSLILVLSQGIFLIIEVALAISSAYTSQIFGL